MEETPILAEFDCKVVLDFLTSIQNLDIDIGYHFWYQEGKQKKDYGASEIFNVETTWLEWIKLEHSISGRLHFQLVALYIYETQIGR